MATGRSLSKEKLGPKLVEEGPRDEAESLILGWQVDSNLDPQFWLTAHAGPGTWAEGDLVTVPADRMEKHTVILGQSGSGKSFFLGRLLEELLVRTKARCLVLDPNSDFRRFAEVKKARKKIPSEQPECMWVNPRYDKTTGRGQLTHERSRNEFTKAWNQVSIAVLAGSGLREGEQRVVLAWSSVPIDLLLHGIEPLDRGATRNCHEFTSVVEAIWEATTCCRATEPEPRWDSLAIAEQLYDVLAPSGFPSRLDFLHSWLQNTVVPPPRAPDPKPAYAQAYSELALAIGMHETGLGDTQSPIEQRTLLLALCRKAADCLVRTVNTEQVPAARLYFSLAREFQRSGLVCVPQSAGLPYPLPDRVTVVDLPSIREADMRRLVVETLLQAEWEEAYSRWSDALVSEPENDRRVPTFIVVDEAHNLIQKETTNPAEAGLRERFRRIVAEGRKLGLFLLLATQRPDKLDPFVLSECENVALLKLSTKGVLDETIRIVGLTHLEESRLTRCLSFRIGRALLIGHWAPKDQEPAYLYSQARRTVEGGRNLRSRHWAHRRDFNT